MAVAPGAMMAFQIIGAGLSAYSAFSQASAQKGAAEYQAAVQRNNALVATWQAEDAIRRGEADKQRVQTRTAALKGRQRAMLAERGLDLGEGSALDLLSDTDMAGAVDSNTAIDNAAREAFGYKVNAGNHDANAALLKYKADTTNPTGAAMGSLLTSGGQVASSWYSMTEKGVDPFGFGKKNTGSSWVNGFDL